jgi:SAM-dependent methyltransferase
MTFTFWGTELDYFDHSYNSTRLNERAVEVPIAQHWLETVSGDGLELGNVMQHYGCTKDRDVVDRYEDDFRVLPLDVFEITDTYDWILAISTLEHVRWDRPERREVAGARKAFDHLLGLLKPGGRMLVTIPMGHHPHLDPIIMSGQIHATRDCTLVRDGEGGWRQTPVRTWEPYGKTTLWAESVWIGEFA